MALGREVNEAPKESSLSDMINTLGSVVENPVSRYLLRRSTIQCKKDGARRLEVGLEIYLGIRETACTSCRITAGLVGSVVRRGASTFGVSQEDLHKQLNDAYWRKGLVNVITGISRFGIKRPFTPGAPFQVVWNITHACNFKCMHCYENAGRKGEDELTREQVFQGIDTLSRVGISSLAISGGEPTLHPHVKEFIHRAYSGGIYVSMATNGYRFADRTLVKQYKDSGLGFVQVSLDGLDPMTHDTFRGVPGAWDHAVAAIDNALAEGLTVCISTTCTSHNIKEIPGMLDWAKERGVKWYMLYNFIPAGRGLEIVQDDLSPYERKALLEKAFLANSGGMQVLSTAPQYAPVAAAMSAGKKDTIIPTHFANPQYSGDTMQQLAEFIGGCGAGRFYLAVEPNGDMYPCVFLPHEPELKIGNLMTDDFERVWQEQEVLRTLRDKDRLKGGCATCHNRYICGGCRSRAYGYFHDLLAPDPGCVNNIEYWEKLKGTIAPEDMIPMFGAEQAEDWNV